MAIDNMLNDASCVMTVISFVAFVGILWWAFVIKRSADFEAAAHLPFADDKDGCHQPNSAAQVREQHHG